MELLCVSLGLSILCSLEHRAQTLYCVYTLRTRYVTVNIVTLFAPSDAGLRHELSSDYRVVDCARWNTETRCPLFFFLEYKVSTLYSGTVPEFLLVTWKKVCSHQYPASTVLGHRARAPSVNAASVSSGEASLCWGEAGEKEKENARGTMGRGKRRRETSGSRHSLFSSSPARFQFFLFDYCYFIGIPSGSFCGGERRCLCFWITWAGIGRLMISIQYDFPQTITLVSNKFQKTQSNNFKQIEYFDLLEIFALRFLEFVCLMSSPEQMKILFR